MPEYTEQEKSEVEKISGIAEKVGKIAGIEEKVGKIAGIEEKVGKIAGLEEKVGKIAGIEEKVGKIDGIEEKVGKIDGIESKVDEISNKIERLGKHVGAHEKAIIELNDENLDTIKFREEYLEMWKRQKTEATARENLNQNPMDQDLEELIQQRGLETSVDKEVILRLATSKEDLKALLEKCDRGVSSEDARFLANMSYAYILMAEHYKIAREHVIAVAAEKGASDYFKEFAWGSFKLALSVGLAVASGGITGVIGAALPFATAATQQDENAKFTGIGNASNEAHTGEAIGTAVSGVLDIVADWATGGTDSDSAMVEPYDFFLDKEKGLRKAAAYLANLKTQEEREKIKLELKGDIDESAWGFFSQPPTSRDKLDKGWGEFSNFLSVFMRRLCWQLYCRSQWQNRTYDYTFSVDISHYKKSEINIMKECDATEWGRSVWKNTGTGYPKHWKKVCSDFRGSEHDPFNPYTVANGKVNEAREYFHRSAWISLAVVHCCQIERSRGFGKFNWSIDLTREKHYTGHSPGEKVQTSFKDYQLLFEDLNTIDENGVKLEDILKNIRSKGGDVVRINEIRFGRWDTKTKASGKKGRLDGPNDQNSPILVGAGCKVSVILTATSRTTNNAKVGINGVLTNSEGEYKRHISEDGSSAKACDTPCVLCQGVDVKDLNKETYVLRPLAGPKYEDRSKNFFTHTEQTLDLQAPSEEGIYCVRLDPRIDLQTKDRQFHVSDEWWFRTIKVPEGRVNAWV